MGKRQQAIKVLDRVKFRLLTTRFLVDQPQTKYQPLPFLGISEAKRSQGCQSRLESILNYLERDQIEEGIVVDYGCNIGFFAMSLGLRGFLAYGFEKNEKNVAVGETAARICGAKFYPVAMPITTKSVLYVPRSDVTLCLSLWHHWVRVYGMDAATSILKVAFSRTRSVLFFDTGEQEMTEKYGLPFTSEDPKTWLEKYFHDVLQPTKVEWLGRHKAFAPGARESAKGVERNLFAVAR